MLIHSEYLHSGYTMLLMKYIALVLLVATVAAVCTSDTPANRSWESTLCTALVCVIKSVAASGGGFNMGEIFKCFSRNIQTRGEGDSIHFSVINSAADNSTRGTIANAGLEWGKWTAGGMDVATVSGMHFDSTSAASFVARGRQNSPSGTAGSFEIHEADEEGAASRKVASVMFGATVWGNNFVKLLNEQPPNGYLCQSPGMENNAVLKNAETFMASVVAITCHKMN